MDVSETGLFVAITAARSFKVESMAIDHAVESEAEQNLMAALKAIHPLTEAMVFRTIQRPILSSSLALKLLLTPNCPINRYALLQAVAASVWHTRFTLTERPGPYQAQRMNLFLA